MTNIDKPLEEPTTGSPRAYLHQATSQQYAAKATSRLLTKEQNQVLTDAAKGKEVDVVEFRKAATAALSLAATRAGQSMARREWTREARHLIYWADAILDQHIQGLPIYEAGARSPKIASLESVVDKHQTYIADLEREIDENHKQAVAEGARLSAELKDADERLVKVTEERDGLQDRIDLQNETISEVAETLRESGKVLDEVVAQRDFYSTIIAYVLETASPEYAALVTGYADGIADAHGLERLAEVEVEAPDFD